MESESLRALRLRIYFWRRIAPPPNSTKSSATKLQNIFRLRCMKRYTTPSVGTDVARAPHLAHLPSGKGETVCFLSRLSGGKSSKGLPIQIIGASGTPPARIRTIIAFLINFVFIRLKEKNGNASFEELETDGKRAVTDQNRARLFAIRALRSLIQCIEAALNGASTPK